MHGKLSGTLALGVSVEKEFFLEWVNFFTMHCMNQRPQNQHLRLTHIDSPSGPRFSFGVITTQFSLFSKDLVLP